MIPPQPRQNLPGLGTLFLASGVVLGCLAMAELSTGLPFRMPVFWYRHREAWGLIALIFCVFGASLLRTSTPKTEGWKPTQPGQRFRTLVLYTREGCHLCDQAHDQLIAYRRYLPKVTEVDIDQDPELIEKFGHCVPVVACDGRVRFRGHINEKLLRRLIEGTPPLPTASCG